MPGVRARVDLIRWSWGGQPSRTVLPRPPVLLPTAPLPELGRTRQGLVAAGAWTRPWGPGPQLQLRPPGTGPQPQRPLLPSDSRPLAASVSCHVPALGAGAGGSARPPPRLCTEAEDQDNRYTCVMVRAPCFMKRVPGSLHVRRSQHKILYKCQKPPGQLGNLLTLGKTAPPPTPASGAPHPPPSPTALARCCPPACAQFWGEAPCSALPAALRLSLRPKCWEQESRDPGGSLFFK